MVNATSIEPVNPCRKVSEIFTPIGIVHRLIVKKMLVDVAGIEPATPCLQILGARKMNNLRGVATEGTILLQVTTP
jgi:hypothetical protein